MKELIELFTKEDREGANLERIEKLLVDFNPYLTVFDTFKNDTNEYLRIPIYEGNFSVYVMKWPLNGVSTIHEHKNISGIIKILRGKIKEKTFAFDETEKKLYLKEKTDYSVGKILMEEENAIHQVINISEKEEALTLHVYFPSVLNLEGSRLFNVQERKIGVLNSAAISFGWSQPSLGFSEIIKNSFEYVEA